MSQALQILDHIRRHGSITPAEAYQYYGCLALHSRAAELRNMGYDVPCAIKTDGNKRWGCYSLRGQTELGL